MGRSIRQRVALGLTVLVIVAGGMTAWLYRAVGDAAALADRAADVSRIRQSLLELERVMAQAHLEIAIRLADERAVPPGMLEQAEQAFRQELRRRLATSVDPDERASLQQLEMLGGAYFAAARDSLRPSRTGAGRRPETLLHIRQDMVALVAARSAALARQQANGDTQRAASAHLTVQRHVMVVSVGFVILAIGVGVLLLRAATRPLRALGTAITEMGSGNLTYRLAETGPSEFVAIARRFNRLADARQAAETERARLSQAIEQAAEAVLVTAPDGRIVYVNPAFEQVSGYTRAEAIGMTPRIVHSGRNSPDTYRDLWSTIRSGRTWKGELVNRHRSGALYVERQTISPVRDAAGCIEAFVSIGADVTMQRRLETQVNQSAKMEAVGRLAGGVAHDFNNLLMIIAGSAEKLARRRPATADEGAVDAIARATDQAAALTRRLLAFSRQQTVAPRPTDLNEVVRGVEQMLRRLIGEDVRMLTCTTQEIPAVRIDPGQVEQILMNLAANARDAMPCGGRLLIETSESVVTPGVPGLVGVAPGRYVRLTVSDSGTGMDADTQRHLFEPFYTTKPAGCGTGLGLSTVYGIVRQAGGHIDVLSEPDCGTTFSIMLPACAEAAEAARPPALHLPPVRGHGVVLLAEDDADVRELLSTALAEAGYLVTTATDGASALACAARMSRLDLLVTDMVMPGLGGIELAATLYKSRPGLPVIYVTGYAPGGPEQRLVPGARFVQKPVSIARLSRIAAELLGSASAHHAPPHSQAV